MGGVRVAKKITPPEKVLLEKILIQRIIKFLDLNWDQNHGATVGDDDSITWNGKLTRGLSEDEMMDELMKEYGRKN